MNGAPYVQVNSKLNHRNVSITFTYFFYNLRYPLVDNEIVELKKNSNAFNRIPISNLQ